MLYILLHAYLSYLIFKNVEILLILMHLRLSNDDLSVALVQKPSGKKDGKRILYNWNDAEIKTISEAAEATQVHYTFFRI